MPSTHIMPHILFIILLLALAVNPFFCPQAQAEAILKTITRNDDSIRLQLTFEFDQIPVFNFAATGRRINLIVRDVIPNAALFLPATDDKMIKIVRKVEKNGMLLSFYFRYPPQKVTSETRNNTIVLDILLGDQQSVSRPELSAPPQTTGAMQKTNDHSPPNPVNISVFAKNWHSFFIKYESPLKLLPPPKLHLPPFPLMAAVPSSMAVTDWLPEEILTLAKEDKWFQTGLLLREQVRQQPVEQIREWLVLTYAEAMIRDGEYKEPSLLLQQIILQYPDTPMAGMAAMLQIYQEAHHGNPIDAYYELRNWLDKNGDSPLSGSYHLLLAELAILSNRLEDAKKLLDDPSVTSDLSLASIRQLRQADLLAAANQRKEALAAYEDLTSRLPLIETDPMSLARFADELYSAGQYAKAANRYQQLADLLINRPQQDLALFRLALAQLHVPATAKKAQINLLQISNAFPDTDGGLRSQIKQADMSFVAGRMPANDAETIYGNCAIQADSVAEREECRFKMALVKALSDDSVASVNQSMRLLHEFQSGRLRTEAMALLIQQFPGAVKRLVKNGEYVKALVLAKQNKYLFTNGWLDAGPLYDLALACDKLGLTGQAAEIYQYLFDISDETGQEKIYLPLIQSQFASGRYVQLEEYANRYLARYPQGADRAAIFTIKVLAYYNSGQTDKALALMTDGANPKPPELELLKGRLYFEQQDWHKAIDALAQPEIREMLARHAMLFPLAESYFQTGQDEPALSLFQQIVARNLDGNEQVRFRLAQIAQRTDNKLEALKLFKDLAEKGTDPFWTKLAREEAAILELNDKW